MPTHDPSKPRPLAKGEEKAHRIVHAIMTEGARPNGIDQHEATALAWSWARLLTRLEKLEPAADT